jgi:membrane-bound lytic murein transglycosylase A
LRRKLFILLLVFASIAACAGPEAVSRKPRGEKPTKPAAPPALVRLSQQDYPDFIDGAEPFSLARAAAYSIDYFLKLPRKQITFGNDRYSALGMAKSLSEFREFLLAGPSAGLIKKYVTEEFNVYESTGEDGKGRVLFTGYYCPEIEASLTPDGKFKYPLYKKPDDLVLADLGRFRKNMKGTLLGRVENGRFVPYHKRKEIREGALDGRGLEIAWCADPTEIFFLQVQGSGVLLFPDGTTKHINYAGENGRKYKSIGAVLSDKCRAEGGVMSLEWLKNYLHSHPGEMDSIMDQNKNYVFFTLADDGPFGCLGEPVTGGRSIAVDHAVFPSGALAYVDTQAPEFTGANSPSGWPAYKRFVLAQDAGGAIKGPGRVDIYFGYGDDAGKKAGWMKRDGRLYFLAAKDALILSPR